MGCEQKIKAHPPLLARAIAISDPDTDCMLAETKGRLRENLEFWPFWYFATGVFRETFSGR